MVSIAKIKDACPECKSHNGEWCDFIKEAITEQPIIVMGEKYKAIIKDIDVCSKNTPYCCHPVIFERRIIHYKELTGEIKHELSWDEVM